MIRTPLAATLLAGTVLLAQTAYAAAPGYVVETTAMRAGPDSDYPTVRLVHDGREVFIHGCLDDWSWCDVSYHLDRGWVQGQDLDADYDGRRAGIASIAPMLGLAVLAFSFDDYWGRYYHDRPFFAQRDHWQHYSFEHHRDNWGPRPDHGGGRQDGSRTNFHADDGHARPGAQQHPEIHQDHQQMNCQAPDNHANAPFEERSRAAHQENRTPGGEHPQAAAMHAPPMHQENRPAVEHRQAAPMHAEPAHQEQRPAPQQQHAQPQQQHAAGGHGDEHKKDEH